MTSTPRTEGELRFRAELIAGRTLGELAGWLGLHVPADLSRDKGWMGTVVERSLGADAGAAAGPDLVELGVEIKTIPLAPSGKPRESTWVCTAPMKAEERVAWADSPVRHKLACVLWVPLQASGPPGSRRIGVPRLWRPDDAEEAVLRDDWDALTGLLADGEVEQWTAHHGQALQLRPKAARGSDTTWVVGADGEWVRTMPLGFYLRARFTHGVLTRVGATAPS